MTSLVRLATAGSVDDGKSTLIGRLLYDSKSIFQDQLDQVEAASRRRHGEDGLDLSLLTDGLRAEREQGITIDVAYRYFKTPRRTFVLADTPGHVQYTRNMVTGASTADLAIVLVDARSGVVQQTRRHAFIASLLGIPHLVVAVNKMDLVDYSQVVFDQIVEDFTGFASRLSTTDVSFIPTSALLGDNVVERSANMPWYDGPPLLYLLETVHVAGDRNLVDVRFPVQWVVRDGRTDYRGYAGQVAGGVLRVDDEVLVLPSGRRSTVAAIDTFEGPIPEAYPPMSVTVRLADDVDVSRGDVLCRPRNLPTVSRDIDATMCWMSDRPMTPGARYMLKLGTRKVQATVSQILYRVDVDTLRRDEQAPELPLNAIGRVRLRAAQPLVFDSYASNRQTGAFILIEETTNDTVGGGMILGETQPEVAPGTPAGDRSANVVWDNTGLSRERRRRLGFQGWVLWLTGLPGSGKSTIAAGVEELLVTRDRLAYRLDGDNLRHGLNGNLGFDPADRAENVRRTAHAARLLADAGAVVVVSLVSPYSSDREEARRIAAEWDVPFREIWVSAPLEVCEERDPKGLYARARAGELTGMTGIDDPYEAPMAPDLVLTGQEPTAQAVAAVLRLIGS